MGYDPETEPRLLTFALAFDLTARSRSLRWQDEHIEKPKIDRNVASKSRAIFDEWARTVPPEVSAALTR